MVFINPAGDELYFPHWLKIHAMHLGIMTRNLHLWKRVISHSASREEQKARPLAIVLDIDEVLCCNLYAPECLENDGFYIADFFKDPRSGYDRAWPRGDRLTPPYDGALELVQEAVKLNLKVFFITGRRESIRKETLETFCAAGFTHPEQKKTICYTSLQHPDGDLIMYPNESSVPIQIWKEKQREQISKLYRIMLNVGDQKSDLGRYGDIQYLVSHPFYITD